MIVTELLKKIYLELNDRSFETAGLLHFEEGRIITPLSGDTLELLNPHSSLKDEVIEYSLLRQVLTALRATGKYKGINHIGFCYQVNSKDEEIARIIDKIQGNGFHVYEEPSNDETAWIFIGDRQETASPFIELLPHAGTSQDKEVAYWLPHVHFDIDTGLLPEEIVVLTRKFIDDTQVPFPKKIAGVIYFQRLRIGSIGGINIFLDISTKNRDLDHRKNWQILS